MHPQDTTGSCTVRVPLRSRDGAVRAYALIDAADWPLVSPYTWRLDRAGRARCWAYDENGRVLIFMHRLIAGLPARRGRHGAEVDHVNRDRLDNRRGNLRIVPHAANVQNCTEYRGSRSSYRGVDWHRGRWRARVQVNGKSVEVGHFPTEETAAEAARDARLRLLPYATD